MDDWIDAKKNPPKETGWYRIKTLHGEYEAPVTRNLKGDLVWVLPDDSIITHYRKNDKT